MSHARFARDGLSRAFQEYDGNVDYVDVYRYTHLFARKGLAVPEHHKHKVLAVGKAPCVTINCERSTLLSTLHLLVLYTAVYTRS